MSTGTPGSLALRGSVSGAPGPLGQPPSTTNARAAPSPAAAHPGSRLSRTTSGSLASGPFCSGGGCFSRFVQVSFSRDKAPMICCLWATFPSPRGRALRRGSPSAVCMERDPQPCRVCGDEPPHCCGEGTPTPLGVRRGTLPAPCLTAAAPVPGRGGRDGSGLFWLQPEPHALGCAWLGQGHVARCTWASGWQGSGPRGGLCGPARCRPPSGSLHVLALHLLEPVCVRSSRGLGPAF